MRPLLLLVLCASGCRGDERAAQQARELAELRARVEAVEARPVMLAPAPSPTAALRPADDLAARFSRIIEREPIEYVRYLGMPAAELFDEAGHVRNPAATAARVREVTMKRSGKSVLEALMGPSMFGPEVGAAVFYGKIK